KVEFEGPHRGVSRKKLLQKCMTAHSSSYWNKAFSTQISLELLEIHEADELEGPVAAEGGLGDRNRAGTALLVDEGAEQPTIGGAHVGGQRPVRIVDGDERGWIAQHICTHDLGSGMPPCERGFGDRVSLRDCAEGCGAHDLALDVREHEGRRTDTIARGRES